MKQNNAKPKSPFADSTGLKVCCPTQLEGAGVDQLLQKRVVPCEGKAKILKDQEEEELEETDLMEKVKDAPQETRIKDPVSRHKILTPSNCAWIGLYC